MTLPPRGGAGSVCRPIAVGDKDSVQRSCALPLKQRGGHRRREAVLKVVVVALDAVAI